MFHTVRPLLVSMICGAALIGGHLQARPLWQKVTPDTLVVSSVVDSLPYRIPSVSVLSIPRDSGSALVPESLPSEILPQFSPRTDLFGRDFARTGSISRGFLIGSNRDATVVSGFRLQFSGPVTSDVSVNAALTDENSPIQPEGTTQSLREVDKVSIELNGPTFGLTLGDFFFDRSKRRSGEFGQVSRKVQGLKGSVQTNLSSLTGLEATVDIVGASSRAEYHTLLIQGVEGVQGPYRLAGKNGERYIVVVAGSERVSINGEELVRGEIRDYTIDYATGEITFTTGRMITSDSRIYVDFEYADRTYSRNIIGAGTEISLASDDVQFGMSFLQEADDPDNPVVGPIDEATLSLLRASGNDRLKASTSGILFVGVDSLTGLGRGQYAVRDTILQGRPHDILVYDPGAPDALYSVTFTRIDQVPADTIGYRRVQGGEYVVVGVGQGTHVPRIFIEPPRLQRSVSGHIASNVGGGLRISAEGNRSSLDKNRLSGQSDASNDGSAYAYRIAYDPGELRLFGTTIGIFSADLDQRYVDQRFSAFGRIDPVEYAREWDVAADREATELRRQFHASYSPWSPLTISAFLGTLSRSDGIRSDRQRASVRVNDSVQVNLRASAERLKRRDDPSNASSTWDRYAATAGLSLDVGRPSIDLRFEERIERPDSMAFISEGSFRSFEIIPRFETVLAKGWSMSGSGAWKQEDSSLAGSLAPSFQSSALGVSTSYGGARSAQVSVDLQTRRSSFTDAFRSRGNKDSRTTLVRSQVFIRPFRNALETRMLYEFSSQQSSRLERIFIRVASGTGQYSYTGDTNGNGLADEAEFEPVRYDGDYSLVFVPGETLVPVNAVKASFRLRFRPKELGVGGFLSRLSTESYARVEEKSTASDVSSIALLHVSKFLDPTATISGQQLFTSDIHFDESDPSFSMRVRFSESRGLTQLVSAPVRSYGNERSLRVRARMSNEITDQVDVSVRRDRSLGDLLVVRNRDIHHTSIAQDLSYRLDRYWEIGLQVGLSRSENISAGNTGVADLNEQGIRVTYGVPTSGSVRAELRREEITLANATGSSLIPYEMTGGRPVGRSWLADVRADFRLTDIVQLTAMYTGRIENSSRLIHTARIEARAVF